MSESMRRLFSRRGVSNEFVSLRDSLTNHLGGTAISLRTALTTFEQLAGGDGFDCGCRRANSVKVDLGFMTYEAGGVVPSWVRAGDPRDHRERSRTLEGVLVRSSITNEDFPLRPWHSSFDWNLFVDVDPQYRYLVSREARDHHLEKLPEAQRTPERTIIECERETAFFPLWAIPQEGTRVWIAGRWIFDCGHGGRFGHRTEIHPPKAIVSFRSEAATFDGNSGPTRANLAVIYIGRRGGYIDQPITDQDYAFDFTLPPRPHPAAEPRAVVTPMTGTLPVQPQISFFPEGDARSVRVLVPLLGVTKTLDEYGAIVAAGWSDVDGKEARRVRRFRVRFGVLDGRSAEEPPSDDNWDFLYAANGRWHRTTVNKDQQDLGQMVEVLLHEDDPLHVTACGLARRKIAVFIGAPSSVPPRFVSQRVTDAERDQSIEEIRNAFLRASARLGPPKSLDNATLHRFSKIHRPVRPDSFSERAVRNPGLSQPGKEDFDYTLNYTIEAL